MLTCLTTRASSIRCTPAMEAGITKKTSGVCGIYLPRRSGFDMRATAMKPQPQSILNSLTLDYRSELIGNSYILHADAFEWLSRIPENSLHAIVTDPPYGVKEYNFDQLEKLDNGNGGIWRIPPSFDGHTRSPLPRFTALNPKERDQISEFFTEWAKVAVHALRPGAHVFIASNSFLSQL